FIEHYAINSEIYAGERVVSLRNEGLLRGGKIYSEDGIEVKEIGSENHVQTEIGINFNYSRFNAELQELSDQAKKKESELELVSKKIKFLKLLNQRLDELSDKKQEEYKNLLYKAKNLKEKLQSIEDKKDKLNAITDEDFKDKLIIVRGKIYNEVEINMGNLQHKLDQQYESVKIYRDSNNICIQKL
ncbi:MAG: FapA family protein, partial [Candidatus Marinimicrobia bacterium]|nr:FapA family protein [Candidatus Neomarinimicrobiota bacterium]